MVSMLEIQGQLTASLAHRHEYNKQRYAIHFSIPYLQEHTIL